MELVSDNVKWMIRTDECVRELLKVVYKVMSIFSVLCR